jgi:16S rRNA (cytosine967-C5)-methyltransferase
MSTELTTDRRVASRLLSRQLKEEGRLDLWLADATATLSSEEARRVRALVYGINRQRSFLASHLSPYLKRPLADQSPIIQVALLLGAYEILFQDGVPDRAAVSQAVQLVREVDGAGRTGLINAILRRMSRKEIEPKLPTRDFEPVAWAEYVASHPRWIARRMAGWAGKAGAADWAEANNERPPLWIRRSSEDGLLPEDCEESELVPGAFRVRPPSGYRVDQLRGFAEGHWWVQDLAAQAVAALLAAQPGEKILDACAAPGGKSFSAAVDVGVEGSVLAMDRSSNRLESVRKSAQRLGMAQITCEQRDLLASPWDGPTFDAVLLDAPCSGLGVIRRHPEIRWTREAVDLRRQAARQKTLMSCLASAVRPGGRLVYAVCSFSKEETNEVVDSFLEDSPSFRKVPADTVAPGLDSSLFEEGVLRTYPHRHDADAFFGAVLERVS